MYLLAFHAFLRIGEITGLPPPLGNCLSVNDIKFLHGDSEGLEIQMSKFKHSTGKHIPLLFLSSNNSNKAVCPVHSLWSYLQLRGKESSNVQPLFSFMDNAPITRSFFNSQLQLSLKCAGLNVKNYKSHSFRIGAATTAWAKGFKLSHVYKLNYYYTVSSTLNLTLNYDKLIIYYTSISYMYTILYTHHHLYSYLYSYMYFLIFQCFFGFLS